MTNHFHKVAKKRERPSKRARNPDSGQFEDVNPLNDPELLDQCVRWIRAAEELAPLMAALARSKGEGDEEAMTRMGAKFIGGWLLAFRATLVDQIAHDKDSSREVKKPRVLTAHQAEMRNLMLKGDL